MRIVVAAIGMAWLAACGGSGSVAPARDAGTDAPPDAAVLGQHCPPASPKSCCDPTFVTACKVAGGYLETCTNMTCVGVPASATCEPPAVPDAGSFGCATVACAVGSVCVYGQPAQDGCSQYTCMPPPAACASTPTCGCIEANAAGWLPGGDVMCQADADGNLDVSYWHL